MKVQTTAGQLRSALGAFRGVIDNRRAIPVLGTVLFKDGRLVGANLDTEVSVALPSIGKMEGEACVDWRALHALSRCVDDGETVILSDDDSIATAAFNGSKYQMASLPASEFQEFSPAQGVKSMTGNLGLVAAMNRVRFSMSTEETRYYLNGCAIVSDPEGNPVLAATTGHQLAMMPLDGAPEGSIGSIIPRDLVHYLCSRKAEPESCLFDSERVRATFEFAGISLRAKLIDGKFPDIWRVIPKDRVPVFSTDRMTVLRVLMRLRDFVHGRYVPVKLDIKGDVLTLSINNIGLRATEKIPVEGGGTRGLRGWLQHRLPDHGHRRPTWRSAGIRVRSEPWFRTSRHHERRRSVVPASHADAAWLVKSP